MSAQQSTSWYHGKQFAILCIELKQEWQTLEALSIIDISSGERFEIRKLHIRISMLNVLCTI